ncbi:Uncharacterised protein [uncultured archaeon]|nr:Uncharacterised protein [uncultured archaeon]
MRFPRIGQKLPSDPKLYIALAFFALAQAIESARSARSSILQAFMVRFPS